MADTTTLRAGLALDGLTAAALAATPTPKTSPTPTWCWHPDGVVEPLIAPT